MQPGFPRSHMIEYVYVEKGMFREALADAQNWRHSDGTPVWEVQAFIYSRAGEERQARSALKKWERWHKAHHTPITGAELMAQVAIGRRDEAIALLEEAYNNHSNALMELKVGPYFDPLRGDPRFQDLLRRLGLADKPASPSALSGS